MPKHLNPSYYEQSASEEHILMVTTSPLEDSQMNNIQPVMDKILPQEFNLFPKSLDKTREFYEYVLIDTKSFEIKHQLN